ncbi:MAG: Ribosomal protein S6 kinase beta-2 [Marteilia pararefringens]
MGEQLEFTTDHTKRYKAKFKVIDEIGRGGFGTVYLIRTRKEYSSQCADKYQPEDAQKQCEEEDGKCPPINALNCSGKTTDSNEADDISDLQDYEENDQMYAMKVIRISRICKSTKQLNYAKNEMKLLSSIDHPLIVKLFYAFHCSKRLYLIMELLNGGDLASLKEKMTVLTETEVRFYSASILIALEHLHSMLIIYRDLKPENVMFDVTGRIKLVDFGLCRIIDSCDDKAHTICGTIEYLAPEIVSRKSYDRMIDFWSLGVLIYDLLLGHPPFIAKDKKKLINQITSQAPNLPNLVHSAAANLIKNLLAKNPQKRLGNKDPDELRNHRFYRNISFHAIFSGELESPAQLEESKTYFRSNNEMLNNKQTMEWSILDNHSQIEKLGATSDATNHSGDGDGEIKKIQNMTSKMLNGKDKTNNCHKHNKLDDGNSNRFDRLHEKASFSQDTIHINKIFDSNKSGDEIETKSSSENDKNNRKNGNKDINQLCDKIADVQLNGCKACSKLDLKDPLKVASLFQDFVYVSPSKRI